MKDIKFIIAIFYLLQFLSCKPEFGLRYSILSDGHYILGVAEAGGGPHAVGHYYYYVRNDIVYAVDNYVNKNICFDRIAGSISKKGDSLYFPFLPIQQSPCIFINDRIGGDSCIFHFSQVSTYSDPIKGSLGLNGNYYWNPQFSTKREGTFTFLKYAP